MVLVKSLAVVLFTAATAFAAPAQCCMTKKEAQSVANNFGSLISSYTTSLANKALTKDYTDYSESVNTLINSCPTGNDQPLPLLNPTFTNRTAFEQGQGTQPQNNYEQLDIWHSCESVTVRWLTTNAGSVNPKPIVGIYTAIVQESKQDPAYPWKINTVYSEFDSGAWLQNLIAAGVCPTDACSSSNSTSS